MNILIDYNCDGTLTACATEEVANTLKCIFEQLGYGADERTLASATKVKTIAEAQEEYPNKDYVNLNPLNREKLDELDAQLDNLLNVEDNNAEALDWLWSKLSEHDLGEQR
ncbi:hypothetical protein NVP2275O_132 [Vibrio phage 2.275.O._10N.286.54.E11]|nr:hypothetical protein NVP2275O_132 [Vibrio phage 2.275.O._10N.286.54.E11]